MPIPVPHLEDFANERYRSFLSAANALPISNHEDRIIVTLEDAGNGELLALPYSGAEPAITATCNDPGLPYQSPIHEHLTDYYEGQLKEITGRNHFNADDLMRLGVIYGNARKEYDPVRGSKYKVLLFTESINLAAYSLGLMGMRNPAEKMASSLKMLQIILGDCIAIDAPAL